MDIFEADLWCDCTQYGGDVIGEVTGESRPSVSSCAFGDVLVLS
jgi:hypothetical protein